MHNTAVRRCLAAAALMAAMIGSSTAVQGQSVDLRRQTTRGIGYSASLPDVLAGAGVWQFFGASRIGVFVDAKVTVPSLEKDENFCPAALGACNAEWVESNRNDFRLASDDEYLLINAGGMYALSPGFALMLGAGMARRTTYHEYIDDNEIPEARITWEGNYYVPEEAEWEPQVVAGVLMRIAPRVAFTFGVESATKAMSVGAYLILP